MKKKIIIFPTQNQELVSFWILQVVKARKIIIIRIVNLAVLQLVVSTIQNRFNNNKKIVSLLMVLNSLIQN